MSLKTIDKSEYRWAHGKDPRGYGLWLFENPVSKAVYQHHGYYSEAAKHALRWANDRDWIDIRVCS